MQSAVPSAGGRLQSMTTPPQTLFLGVTGASGAAYAARLIEALTGAGCHLTLCVSDAGLLVMRHELDLPGEGREDLVHAFLTRARAGSVAIVNPEEFETPAASGSSFPDAAVICPCSLATVAHIATGAGHNLIHRAADVALKERKPLVLVPREMPLSTVHLRRLLEVAEAGAVILPPAPGFYGRPQTIADIVDFVVGKILQSLGFAQHLYPPYEGAAS
jgi:4-hydroxy-3-polyprenylbenzoate decarboxylase